MNHNNANNEFPYRDTGLRQRRERLGLTRPQLAAQARCSLTTIQNLEAGVTRHGTTKDKIARILDALENQENAA